MSTDDTRFLANPTADRTMEYGPSERSILSAARAAQVEAEITSWPGYEPTPLRNLRGLAAQVGVCVVWYKDEAGRFGLGSFKALGGAYGVLQTLVREVRCHAGNREVSSRDLVAGKHRELVSRICVTCATDGNHGRAVAWGAQTFGCQCVVYLPKRVSRHRETAISSLGATTVRVDGNYDDAVHRAHEDAATHGRIVVSDTSYADYRDIPRDVMQGYTVMVAETLRQLPEGKRPTHVFVQGGVGGLASAVCAHLWEFWGADRPALVVVEPDKAACLFESARKGQPVRVTGPLDTIMACLAAGEVSQLAWEILRCGADAFLTIPDSMAVQAMRLLAQGVAGEAPIVAGESGVAGLGGFLVAMEQPAIRDELRLGQDSRVLLFGTEGATDPEIYQAVVGRPPHEIVSQSRS